MGYCSENGISQSETISYIATMVDVEDSGIQDIYCRVKSVGGHIQRKFEAILQNPTVQKVIELGRDIAAGLGFAGTVYGGYIFTQGGTIAGAVTKIATIAGVSAGLAKILGVVILALIVYLFINYTWPRIMEIYDGLMNSIDEASTQISQDLTQ